MSFVNFLYEFEIRKPELDKIISKMNSAMETSFDSPYTYENRVVPRTTRVLEKCIGSKELIQWSNRLGLYQRTNYTTFLKQAADIGSLTHERIEHFVTTNEHLEPPAFTPMAVLEKSDNSFGAFMTWWNEMNALYHITVIYSEETLSCKYCAGTLDLLVEINGMHYLIDFKTSSYPTYKFFLQTASYRYMLRVTRGIEIDGVIILMLNKNTGKYRELVMSFLDSFNYTLMDMYETLFFDLLKSYYGLISADILFEEYQKGGHNVRIYEHPGKRED